MLILKDIYAPLFQKIVVQFKLILRNIFFSKGTQLKSNIINEKNLIRISLHNSFNPFKQHIFKGKNKFEKVQIVNVLLTCLHFSINFVELGHPLV